MPEDSTHWVRKRGADAEFMQRLSRWRQQVFFGVVGPLVSYGMTSVLFVLYIVLRFIYPVQPWGSICGWVTLGFFSLTLFLSEVMLPFVFKKRPLLEDATRDTINLD